MERLRTELRAQAWIRRAQTMGLMATVVRKGDADAGALFLKFNRFKAGCEVFAGTAAPDGAPAWLRARWGSPAFRPTSGRAIVHAGAPASRNR